MLLTPPIRLRSASGISTTLGGRAPRGATAFLQSLRTMALSPSLQRPPSPNVGRRRLLPSRSFRRPSLRSPALLPPPVLPLHGALPHAPHLSQPLTGPATTLMSLGTPLQGAPRLNRLVVRVAPRDLNRRTRSLRAGRLPVAAHLPSSNVPPSTFYRCRSPLVWSCVLALCCRAPSVWMCHHLVPGRGPTHLGFSHPVRILWPSRPGHGLSTRLTCPATAHVRPAGRHLRLRLPMWPPYLLLFTCRPVPRPRRTLRAIRLVPGLLVAIVGASQTFLLLLP